MGASLMFEYPPVAESELRQRIRVAKSAALNHPFRGGPPTGASTECVHCTIAGFRVGIGVSYNSAPNLPEFYQVSIVFHGPRSRSVERTVLRYLAKERLNLQLAGRKEDMACGQHPGCRCTISHYAEPQGIECMVDDLIYSAAEDGVPLQFFDEESSKW